MLFPKRSKGTVGRQMGKGASVALNGTQDSILLTSKLVHFLSHYVTEEGGIKRTGLGKGGQWKEEGNHVAN